MRSSARRTDKYSKKLRALVLPGQTDRYAPTAADRLHLEYCVKREAITPMLQFSYVAFCEELIKHEASKRPEERDGIYNKWLNRDLDATTLQSVASCIGVSIEIPAPPVCAWSWKRKLTFTGNVSGTSLDDFPILVHLTNANFDFAKAKTNGEDIRFMDTDTCPSDGTPLKHEIEYWSQGSEEAWVWVKVPRINIGVADFIYMFYGNNAAADGQDAVNVWTNGYLAVIHLRGDGTNVLPDSTATYNFTKMAIGSPLNITGKIDGAQYFDAINDDASQTTLIDVMPSALVISLWYKPTDGWPTVPARADFFLSKFNTMGPDNDLLMLFHGSGVMKIDNTRNGVSTVLSSIKNTWLAQPYHLSCHCGTGGMKIYIDGVFDNSNAVTTVPINGTYEDFIIGSYRGTSNWADCSMDEFRVSNVTRNGDWVKAQWKSQDETLITYGAEEAV